VEVAVKARALLEAEGVPTRVVSTPCWELFERQSKAYRAATIGKAPVRVAVEAAVRLGWERFIGEDGAFVGMSSFGASAPYPALYQRFGITAEAVATAAKARL
jgi:transketolase